MYYGNSLVSNGSKLTTEPAPIAKSSVTVNGPFLSPWRCAVVGDIKTLVESDLIDNLSPRAEGDYSWVKPGITSWTWLSEGQSGQNNEKIIRDYIDLAAEMNWSYVLLDDGWQPGELFRRIQRILSLV